MEIRERVEERVLRREVPATVAPPAYESKPSKPLPLFERCSDEELLSYGVPAEWLADVKRADEDGLLALSDHLPAEAAEALLELATGRKTRPPRKRRSCRL